ncbi:hypothetical protein ACFL59_10680 [Planctomycetota bacterium]
MVFLVTLGGMGAALFSLWAVAVLSPGGERRKTALRVDGRVRQRLANYRKRRSRSPSGERERPPADGSRDTGRLRLVLA